MRRNVFRALIYFKPQVIAPSKLALIARNLLLCPLQPYNLKHQTNLVPVLLNLEKSRRSRKLSGNENKSCKSNNGIAGLKDLRVKRDRAIEPTGTSERYDGKRTKICRKRSFRGSDYEHHRKRKAPVLPQSLKRGVPSSMYYRSHKSVRKDINKHPSQEPEILKEHQIRDRQAGPIHLSKRAVEKQEWSLTEPERQGQILTEDTVQLRGDRYCLEGSQQ
ncbi:hypothetical protein TNCV_4752111 [Trichonephila clavipes]|nr:hypothetical protein TNCV_4752111 [Trichonephila clavipes]